MNHHTCSSSGTLINYFGGTERRRGLSGQATARSPSRRSSPPAIDTAPSLRRFRRAASGGQLLPAVPDGGTLPASTVEDGWWCLCDELSSEALVGGGSGSARRAEPRGARPLLRSHASRVGASRRSRGKPIAPRMVRAGDDWMVRAARFAAGALASRASPSAAPSRKGGASGVHDS